MCYEFVIQLGDRRPVWGTGGQVTSVDAIRWRTHGGSNNWLNAPLPVPNVITSSCYPPQFMSSFLAQHASTPQPALSAPVRPSGHATQAKYANNLYSLAVTGTVHPLTNTGEPLGACVSVGRVRVLRLSCRCWRGRGGAGLRILVMGRRRRGIVQEMGRRRK
jgi:hypothetical protein